jgi:hypothetical protein
MHDIAEATVAKGYKFPCYLKPIELWPRVCAVAGFEAAMIYPSGASWHVVSSLFKLKLKSAEIYITAD